jgi:hypothetical protein
MPRPKPPSDELLLNAAEQRVAGATWEAVAKEVHRAARTVRRWPRKYAERWTAALVQAEWRMASQADCESVLTLRKLLLSQDEKVRWRAASRLVARRLERDKIQLKSASTTSPSLSSEAARLIAFLDGQSNEQLSAIIACLPPPSAG